MLFFDLQDEIISGTHNVYLIDVIGDVIYTLIVEKNNNKIISIYIIIISNNININFLLANSNYVRTFLPQ